MCVGGGGVSTALLFWCRHVHNPRTAHVPCPFLDKPRLARNTELLDKIRALEGKSKKSEEVSTKGGTSCRGQGR